jgi:HAD superfamily hydrolase (TIGR01509 family)
MKDKKSDVLIPFSGYIFDVDGTMIDSMKVHMKAWQKTLEHYGHHLSLKEVSEQAFGINEEIVKRFFGENLSKAEIEKISNEKESLFRESFNPQEDVIKGFIHFIDELKKKNLPLVIGSAAPPENINFFMGSLGIGHYFEGVVHEDDVTKGKPSPEVFLKAAEIIKIPIHECVVFEDSPSGAEASANAGSKTIAVLTSKSRADFRDIPNIVEYIKDYTTLLDGKETETQ